MSEFNVRWFYMARGPLSSEMLEQIIYMAVGYLGVERGGLKDEGTFRKPSDDFNYLIRQRGRMGRNDLRLN